MGLITSLHLPAAAPSRLVNDERVERIWRREGVKVPDVTTQERTALNERRLVFRAERTSDHQAGGWSPSTQRSFPEQRRLGETTRRFPGRI